MEEEVSAQVALEKEEAVIAEAEIVLEVASEKQEPVILEMPEEKHEQVVMEEEVSAQVAPEKEEAVIAEAEIVLEVASEKQEPVILEMPEEKHEQVVMEEEVSAQVAPEKEEAVIADTRVSLEVASEKQETTIISAPVQMKEKVQREAKEFQESISHEVFREENKSESKDSVRFKTASEEVLPADDKLDSAADLQLATEERATVHAVASEIVSDSTPVPSEVQFEETTVRETKDGRNFVWFSWTSWHELLGIGVVITEIFILLDILQHIVNSLACRSSSSSQHLNVSDVERFLFQFICCHFMQNI